MTGIVSSLNEAIAFAEQDGMTLTPAGEAMIQRRREALPTMGDVSWSLAAEVDRLRDAIEAKDAEIERLRASELAKENARLIQWIDLHRGDTMSLSNEVESFRSEMIAAESRAEQAEAEALEQARLIGMGAERELALRARVEQAERELDELREWKQNQQVHWPSEIERRNRDLERAECALAEAVEVLRPFATATLTDDGQIIGLVRENFIAASQFVKDHEK